MGTAGNRDIDESYQCVSDVTKRAIIIYKLKVTRRLIKQVFPMSLEKHRLSYETFL